MIYIIKRQRHTQPFSSRKLQASIYAACLAVRTPSGEAATTSRRVIQDIKPWIATKTEVTSLDLRHRASRHLRVYNPHAAFVYKYYDTID